MSIVLVKQRTERNSFAQNKSLIEPDFVKSDTLDVDQSEPFSFPLTPIEREKVSFEEDTDSFVEIDLLASGPWRYRIAAFFTIFTQIPVLFSISYLINGPHQMSIFTVIFSLNFIKLCAATIFFFRRGLSVIDVPFEIRKRLTMICILHLIGSLLFVISLKHLTPVIAVLAMHTGLVALTCIIRIIGLQQLFFTVTLSKLKGVIILM